MSSGHVYFAHYTLSMFVSPLVSAIFTLVTGISPRNDDIKNVGALLDTRGTGEATLEAGELQESDCEMRASLLLARLREGGCLL